METPTNPVRFRCQLFRWFSTPPRVSMSGAELICSSSMHSSTPPRSLSATTRARSVIAAAIAAVLNGSACGPGVSTSRESDADTPASPTLTPVTRCKPSSAVRHAGVRSRWPAIACWSAAPMFTWLEAWKGRRTYPCASASADRRFIRTVFPTPRLPVSTRSRAPARPRCATSPTMSDQAPSTRERPGSRSPGGTCPAPGE